MSTCGKPDRWVRRIADEAECFGFPSPPSNFDCCKNLLRTSIERVGDNYQIWCKSPQNGGKFDVNYCH